MKLEYKIVDATDTVISIQITMQEAKRGCGLVFANKECVRICSYDWPEYCVGKLFIWGIENEKDNNVLNIPLKDWPKIYKIIKEYNDFVPPKKHSIVIDGKTIEISDESFEALKKSFKE